jgi:rubrerythrin
MTESAKPNSLTAALDFEEKGRNFYAKTAGEVADPLSQKLFQTLAADEFRHADRIREIFAALTSGRAWPETYKAGPSLEEKIRDYFEANRSVLNKKTTSLQGYEFAMQMEKTGIELYSKFARETADDRERRFFQALILEEESHLDALQNVYFFLTQTGDWLEADESKRWNWMNV